MKTLQISKFYPPVLGGIESVAWELTEALNRRGVSTNVLCSHHLARGQRERAKGGYDIWRTGSWGTWQSTSVSPAMLTGLRQIAVGHDVLHIHMPNPMAALALFASGSRARVVVHWHSDVIRQRHAMHAYAPLQRWLLQRADAIIVTSAAYGEASPVLRPWSKKLQVIPIGISDNRSVAYEAQAAELRRRLRDRRLVFALGRMTYYKGFDVLIDAAAELPEDCAVLIGGEGELLEGFRRRVAERGLVDKVYLPGRIGDEELASYFAACDVFCMPSTLRAEAYGVAMVEAMVMGKPVVASHLAGSGVPWVNQHGVTGLNFPVGDSLALADTLKMLLRDDAMRLRLGAAARGRYEDEFTAARMAASIHDLYCRLLPA